MFYIAHKYYVYITENGMPNGPFPGYVTAYLKKTRSRSRDGYIEGTDMCWNYKTVHNMHFEKYEDAKKYADLFTHAFVVEM